MEIQQTYLWSKIHNPIEFDNQTGSSLSEAKILILNA